MNEYLLQIEEVYRLLESPFVIFGAGSVGKRFIELVRIKGYIDNLVGVGVSRSNGMEMIDDIPIKNIETIDRSFPVFVAVHDSSYSDIKKYLERLGFKKFGWIYPLLCNLFFGDPIERNIKINVCQLFSSCKIFNYAVYALVIEQMLGNNSTGFMIYKKHFSTISTSENAETRLDLFRERVVESSKKGFIQDAPIRVSVDRTKILDGVHRSVLSYYYGNRVILADLYMVTEELYAVYSSNHILTRERMEEIYDEEEIRLIEVQYQRMNSEIDSNKQFVV